jgi:hypothetical protein
VIILLLATALEFDVPGYHEPPASDWSEWLFAVAWFAGLVIFACWIAFRLPGWLRGPRV